MISRICFCQSGVWRRGTGSITVSGMYELNNPNGVWRYLYMGSHNVCIYAGGNEGADTGTWAYVERYSGSDWRIATKDAHAYAYCLDW